MKKLTILLSALCIPAVAWAHISEGFIPSLSISPIFALVISLMLLYQFNRRIVINNKFLKIVVLSVIEIIFIVLLFIINLFLFLFIYDWLRWL